MVPGEQSVTISVGHGKRAARHIDAWLRGERHERAGRTPPIVTFDMLHLPVYSDADPTRAADLAAAERLAGFEEIVAGLPRREARYEAQRCYSCGNCFECDNCYAACPEDAIVKLGPGRRYRYDYRQVHRLRDLLRAMPVPRHRDGRRRPGGRWLRRRRRKRHPGRQRGRRPCRLPGQRGLRDLSDHALLAHGGAGRRMGLGRCPQHLGQRPGRPGDAERRRARPARCTARCRPGALTTTFTASQGLLLMIPNMFKIAGELTPTVFHVAARSIATQALSIFGDHSDVMATRPTGFALLASGSVQEAHDMALIAQAATLESRVPFLHFFDGFRTSHEVNTLDAGRRRRYPRHDRRRSGARPPRPGAQSRSTRSSAARRRTRTSIFQGREAVNPFYAATPGIVQEAMDQLRRARPAAQYRLFDYDGPADAERVVMLMGRAPRSRARRSPISSAQGEKVGVVAGAPVSARSRPSICWPPCRRACRARGRARPDQGAGRRRRAALSRRRSRRWPRPCRRGERRDHAASHRRALRPVVQGLRPGAGQGRVRRAEKAGAEERLHRRHQSTT